MFAVCDDLILQRGTRDRMTRNDPVQLPNLCARVCGHGNKSGAAITLKQITGKVKLPVHEEERS